MKVALTKNWGFGSRVCYAQCCSDRCSAFQEGARPGDIASAFNQPSWCNLERTISPPPPASSISQSWESLVSQWSQGVVSHIARLIEDDAKHVGAIVGDHWSRGSWPLAGLLRQGNNRWYCTCRRTPASTIWPTGLAGVISGRTCFWPNLAYFGTFSTLSINPHTEHQIFSNLNRYYLPRWRREVQVTGSFDRTCTLVSRLVGYSAFLRAMTLSIQLGQS